MDDFIKEMFNPFVMHKVKILLDVSIEKKIKQVDKWIDENCYGGHYKDRDWIWEDNKRCIVYYFEYEEDAVATKLFWG